MSTDRVVISLSVETVHRIIEQLPEAGELPIREAIELALRRGVLQEHEVQFNFLDLEKAAKVAAQP